MLAVDEPVVQKANIGCQNSPANGDLLSPSTTHANETPKLWCPCIQKMRKIYVLKCIQKESSTVPKSARSPLNPTSYHHHFRGEIQILAWWHVGGSTVDVNEPNGINLKFSNEEVMARWEIGK